MKCPHCDGTGETEDPRVIGLRMRVKREAAKISLRSLADVMRVSAAYVSDLELGKRSWRGDTTERYLNALKDEPSR